MSRALILVTITLLLAVACDNEPTGTLVSGLDGNVTGLSQGISGTVLFWEGDFMPTFPEDDSGGRVYPVMRDVCIFEAVLHQDVQWSYVEIEPGCYVHLASDIPAVLVKVVRSSGSGYFEAELPAGMYSIFVREDGYYYSNLVGGEGFVHPAEVREGETTEVEFDITYMATY